MVGMSIMNLGNEVTGIKTGKNLTSSMLYILFLLEWKYGGNKTNQCIKFWHSLGGCSSQCYEEILPQSCDPQYDQGIGCGGALAAIHSADEHVVQVRC